MRTILVLALALSACTATGGFSLNGGTSSLGGGSSPSSGGGGGGGGGGPSHGHAVVADETRAAIAAHGHPFDVNKDCFGQEGGGVDFHRTPVLYWPCFDFAERPGTAEYSTFARDCDEINAPFGADGAIACRIDHRGFDAHYVAQAAMPHDRDRDNSDPGNYCDMLLGEFAGRHAGSANTLGMLAKPAVRPEFLAKVKTVTCAYDDAKGGTVELVGGDLRLYAAQHADEGGVLEAIRRIDAFPALEAFVQEYGACSGGFSC